MQEKSAPDRARREFVFNQINGFMENGVVDSVKSEGGEDGLIGALITDIYCLRDRLCARTGIDADRDPDLDEMMSKYEQLCRQCGMLMYDYGWQDSCSSK